MHVALRIAAGLITLNTLQTGGGVPASILADQVPEPSAALAAAAAPYLDIRVATFQDWHPRRRDILYTRLTEAAQLFLARIPASRPRQLTSLPEPVAGGLFMPADADRILYWQDTGGAEFHQFYLLDPATSATALLTDGRSRNTAPRWSRDGRLLAYGSTRRSGRATDLYVMDPLHPESSRCVAEVGEPGWSALDWSADGGYLLAHQYVSPNEAYLHLVNLKTGERECITPTTGRVFHGDAQFTAEGTALVMVTDKDSEYRRLSLLDLATRTERQLGPQFDGDIEGIELSPDRKLAAVLINDAGVSRLHIIEVATGRERPVPQLPAGVISGLRWHSNGRDIGFTLSAARIPGDVFSLNLRTRQVTRWTRNDLGALRTTGFVEPESVEVRGFDGLPLRGWLYLPDPARFPGPRPVLVAIHGGPESESRPTFQGRWNFLLEEQGIALLFPNVRGSTGRGKTFVSLDNGRKREDAVKDIGSFLDWISSEPRLDSQRIGVYGGSYGGYMTLASLIHYGDRLRCGIDVVGISDFVTFLRNTQDYRRDLRRAEYGDERDPAMAAFLRSISPMANVHRIKRPLLIAAGANDPRVPLSESEQMVEALRAQGNTVWYVVGRNEGHGFAKRTNADFVFLAIVQFLNAHL